MSHFNYSSTILRCQNDEVIVIPEDIRENLLPPLYGSKRLHVKVTNRYNFSVVDQGTSICSYVMEGTDQISKLPEPILDHILSFLVTKEAVKTSTLSKVWNSVWTSLSCLDFGDNYLRKSKNIVDQILENRPSEKVSIKRFKRLKLTAVAVNDRWLENLLANLPNLELLSLDHCLSLKILKISSYQLKLLKVVPCCNLIAVDLDDAPNLLRFSSDVHHGRKGLLSYFDPLPIFKLKASRLLEVKINLIPDTEALDTHWAITLSCDYDEVIVIPKDTRGKLIPPLYGTKSMHIKIMDRGRSLQSLIKFTYRDAADDEDDKLCCASLAWKCWRHELKRVKLQNFTCMELEKLRNYFSKIQIFRA
ncbi:hypothetical protein HAX54_015478 [Datura stramonium]|uniref:F-box domain-containing protein n=1 Tax=Datura stramonium TaxID=4076 RepID=A0ABS8RZM4_DATST|nr:hypothetical protein [Datura stramonium]